MARTLPSWPLVMDQRTLASYLDQAHENGNVKRTFKAMRELPGFPKPDPLTDRYYRPAVDRFMAQHFGYTDPLQADKAALDRKFEGS